MNDEETKAYVAGMSDEEKAANLEIIRHGDLYGMAPTKMMPHGPSKMYVDTYQYHSPNKGMVASYTVKEKDVVDHFDVFRGVDQIESFAQASVVSCATFLECRKMDILPNQLGEKFIPAFISIGSVVYHYYLELGDTFICISNIKFYKWRQMVCDGRIYKVPKGFNLDAYFRDFNDERLANYDIPPEFKLVTDLYDITGRAILKELFLKEQ